MDIKQFIQVRNNGRLVLLAAPGGDITPAWLKSQNLHTIEDVDAFFTRQLGTEWGALKQGVQSLVDGFSKASLPKALAHIDLSLVYLGALRACERCGQVETLSFSLSNYPETIEHKVAAPTYKEHLLCEECAAEYLSETAPPEWDEGDPVAVFFPAHQSKWASLCSAAHCELLTLVKHLGRKVIVANRSRSHIVVPAEYVFHTVQQAMQRMGQ